MKFRKEKLEQLKGTKPYAEAMKDIAEECFGLSLP